MGTIARTSEGSRVTAFFDPRIQLGCLLDVDDYATHAQFKVVGLRHDADNWEGAFITVAEVRKMEGIPA